MLYIYFLSGYDSGENEDGELLGTTGLRTVQHHDFLDFAERVGSDTCVLAEVVVVGDLDA